MRWKNAQALLLALLCVLCSQHRAEAAYSPAVVRIDTGNANGAFTDAAGNVWAADSNSNAGRCSRSRGLSPRIDIDIHGSARSDKHVSDGAVLWFSSAGIWDIT